MSTIARRSDSAQTLDRRFASGRPYCWTKAPRNKEGDQIFVQRNLPATLQARETKNASKAIQAETGLIHREVSEGDSVRGVYRQAVTLASGRFAMLDDGVGFSLVPKRPVIEQHLGKEIRGVATGSTINWDFSRTRGLGR